MTWTSLIQDVSKLILVSNQLKFITLGLFTISGLLCGMIEKNAWHVIIFSLGYDKFCNNLYTMTRMLKPWIVTKYMVGPKMKFLNILKLYQGGPQTLNFVDELGAARHPPKLRWVTTPSVQ